MYACVYETGSGFFVGVCTPSNATANFRDPPRPLDSPTALCQPCSKSNTEFTSERSASKCLTNQSLNAAWVERYPKD
jgi:hypothetical protein